MSYPGPVGYSVNLGCDTGNQRATDQFNFVVDSGGGDPAPTIPSNLQSPAFVLPAPNNTISLSLVPVVAGSTTTVTIGDFGQASRGKLIVQGGNGGAAIVQLGNQQTGFNNGGVNLEVDGLAPTLSVTNTFSNAVFASVDTINNNVVLGNTAPTGTVTVNRPLLVANIGSSVADPDILTLSDTGANTGQVLVSGNGGTGIVLKGSPNNATATISTDRGTGGLGVLSIGNVASIPQLQFSDSGVDTLVPLSTGLGTLLTVKGNISLNAGSSSIIQYAKNGTGGYAPLANGASITIAGTTSSTVPGGQGLYAIFITAPSDAQAAQVSSVAYWNGTTWQGGAVGNPAFRINPAADFTFLTLLNTSAAPMVGTWTSNVVQLLGNYSS